MAQCKSCGVEISWDNDIRRKLEFNGPAEIQENGKYTKHLCPNYKPKTSTTGSYSYNKVSNPNNYTGSTADYVNKSSQQQQAAVESPLTVQTAKQIVSEIDVTQDVEFLKTLVMTLVEKVEKMQIAFDNFVKDNPAYRAQLEFQARMFPILNSLEGKTSSLHQNTTATDYDFQTADKIKQRFKENFDADMDPVYDQDYKDSIKGKEEDA
jgi:hypothetical protein